MDNFDPASRPPLAAQPPANQGPERSHRRHLTRWAAGIGVAAMLAGGGVALASTSSPGVSLTGPSVSLASAAQLTSAQVRTAIPGLSEDLSQAAAQPCLAKARALFQAGNKAAARQAARGCRLPWRLRLRGEHGTVTFQAKNGPVTIAWERGIVTSAPGTSSTFTVTAKDGTAWTWTLTGKTRIRQGGQRVTASGLALNARVFVFGRVSGGTDTAALVVIAK